MRKLLSLMAIFVISLFAVSLVGAATTSTLGSLTRAMITVEVNDEDLVVGNDLVVEEGEKLDIEVTLQNTGAVDAEGIEVVARLSGYEYSDSVDLEDSTALFDVRAGTRKTVNLELTVPRDLDNGLNTLRVFVLDRNSAEIVSTFELEVESPRHSVDIKDVTFSPGNTVKAGRSLLTSVLVENFGESDQEDVQVTVAIPSLGVSATEYVDEIDAGDREDVTGDYEGGLLLQIPADAQAGDYEVLVSVEYDNGHETMTQKYTLTVLGNEQFQAAEKLVVVVSPESQAVAAGKTAVYGVALSNEGTSSKAYTLSVVTGDWATASLSETLVVLAPGESKVAYVNLNVDANAVNGEHTASLAVKSGEKVMESITLSATVASGMGNGNVDLRNGLEIALIVLVIVLVIVGLIVGFSRLRKDDEDDQSYY
ncbi:MAG: hypothetical protein Q8R37_00035 [Nanoarchaeota archaeon]|nr:hypothetical protein [Nanoarchaeota archaeon]